MASCGVTVALCTCRKLLRDQLHKNPGLVVVIRQMQQRALGITSSTATNTTAAAAVNGQMSTRGATRSSTTTAAAAAAAAASAAAVAKPVLTPEATRQAVIQWETHVQGLPIDPNTTATTPELLEVQQLQPSVFTSTLAQ
eukprot:14995-Heterococcus_DN1.PRE.4